MRELSAVQQDYRDVVSQIGHLEVQKTNFLSNVDKQLAPLHSKCAELQLEAGQIQAVQQELDNAKQKAKQSEVPATVEVNASTELVKTKKQK